MIAFILGIRTPLTTTSIPASLRPQHGFSLARRSTSTRMERTVQQDQDDQAPDVRPGQLRPAPQARHLAPCVTGTTKLAAEPITVSEGGLEPGNQCDFPGSGKS